MATKFTLDGHHVEVTPALEQYVKEKLEKIDNVFVNKVTSIHVVLTVEKYLHTAEAEVKISTDQNAIFATATSKDLYSSIDELEKKLMAQVSKYHGKLIDHERDRT